MSCRRAYELDLPAFVIDPQDPAWDDFRAHYPRCAGCAVEVATWTALQAALAECHPEPEDLLRWHDVPDALTAESRASIARHLERCAACRDELRALEGFVAPSAAGVPAAAASGRATDVPVPADAARAAGSDDTAPAHHASASRAGGRRAERHAFTRAGTSRSGPHPPAGEARRSPVARVLLHPAFAYAVLALVLLLPTVRAALDRDAGRAAFDATTRRSPEQVPAEPAPITAASERAPAAADAGTEQRAAGLLDAAGDPAAGRAGGAPPDAAAELPDDAHVDRTAPRLMRQAPFRAPPPPPPPAGAPAAPIARPAAPASPPEPGMAAAPPPPQPAAAPAPPAARFASTATAKSAAPLTEDTLAGGAEAPPPGAAAAGAPAITTAEADTRDAGEAAGTRGRAPGDVAPLPPIRLLPAANGAGRILVVSLPASATAATDLELRVVDARGGRELRQHVARAAGPGSDLQMTLPAGFTAPVLQIELYADGVGPVLQGAVTP